MWCMRTGKIISLQYSRPRLGGRGIEVVATSRRLKAAGLSLRGVMAQSRVGASV